ncbi:magnesium-translocating P-type ATPase [Methanoculleus chikugoensis]|uniref:magnesium-translocating P-type ATPase n=1 Tax=Methanoculleus chikugoensis TaxID=118126 RepID=UPI0006D190C1|nr:magnesium-translocating P-type ATPase [Methanoculleus chikugoensis]
MRTEDLLTMTANDCLAHLGSSPSGLSTAEAALRQRRYGMNEIAEARRYRGLIAFLGHLKNPLVIILVIAAIVSAFVGEIVEAAIILVIVVLSVTLDFFQEYRAESAVNLLKQKITRTATTLRDGERREIRMTELVPGDVIDLTAGNIVPADARVLAARDFFINQSALTGEPFPVEKTADPPLPAADADRTVWNNYLFLGTSVVSGHATAVVAMTGKNTEYGHIAEALAARPPETEFERGLRHFGYLIMRTTFLLVLIVFLVNAVFKHGVLESLLFAVALAVGLTPELLPPMILSLNLAKGAIAMSEKGVLVKHPEAIQNFGSMDVLCTDKTGTLTENAISLVLHTDPEGHDDETVLLFSYLNSLNQTGLKSPLDEAILAYRDIPVEGYRKIDEIPFDFVRKRASVTVEKDGKRFLVTKGAPEQVFAICSSTRDRAGGVRPFTGELQEEVEHRYEALSADGFRVLAVACRQTGDAKAVYTPDDEKDLVLLGFVAFIDPPKEKARESLQRLVSDGGVDLKIVTGGDNEQVTRKICRDLDFPVRRSLTGAEITHMTDEALARVVDETTIFARVTPIQKDQIIRALMRNNHIVGFLGDGINDAPALRTADVGISVDTAVDIAKESADIVLLEKDLQVLGGDGVMEGGRRTFGNTMKYLMMGGTSSNFGNMFSVAGASLFLPFLPMLPIQILLNNLLYDLSESTIPTDRVDDEYISRPRRWDIHFIRDFILVFGPPISSLFDFITFGVLLLVFHATAPLFQTAWFIESIVTQTLIIFIIRTRMSPFYRSRPSWQLALSTVAVVAAALVVPFLSLGAAFGFVPLPPHFYLVLAGLVVGYLAVVEVVKTRFFAGRL